MKFVRPERSAERVVEGRDSQAPEKRPSTTLRTNEVGCHASDTLALYIHWPFCVSKCPYCDFNSHVRGSIDQDSWRDALLADLAHEARLLTGRELTSIFFGGGTPSLMEPSTVEAIIIAALSHWAPEPQLEI